jgi:hypothetical protein
LLDDAKRICQREKMPQGRGPADNNKDCQDLQPKGARYFQREEKPTFRARTGPVRMLNQNEERA